MIKNLKTAARKKNKQTMSNIHMKREDDFRKLISEESLLRETRKITEQNANTNTLLGQIYEFLKNLFFFIVPTPDLFLRWFKI